MYWDYILSIAGVLGFILAGRKVWWAWYVNIGAQFIWLAYSLVTKQYGFLIGTFIYFAVFVKNAYDWTKEHRESKNVVNPDLKTPVMTDFDETRMRVMNMYGYSVKDPYELSRLNNDLD